jgi:hypothetical protein
MTCKYSLFFLIAIPSWCLAQADDTKVLVGSSAVSVELLGAGQRGSINYERVIARGKIDFLNARIGLGMDPFGNSGLVHGLTVCFGRAKHFLETGVIGNYGNTSLGYADASSTKYFLVPVIGYRKHPAKGLVLKGYLGPVVPTSGSLGISFTIGAAIGFCF